MKIRALIDGDVLRYEIGAVGQYIDDDGNLAYRDWDWVASTLDTRIEDIVNAVGADQPPIVFITGDERILGEQFIPNFRFGVAVSKPYKGTRKQEKPFHFRNITEYLRFKYDCRIANGLEADDLIGIEQFSRLDRKDTVVCTRDKDLRMVPGLHYGWECGKQPEFGPVEYDDIGTITLVKGKSGNKIVGGGKAFFFSQLLTGDTVDNIGGLNQTGPVKAYNLLSECRSEEDYASVIRNQYQTAYGSEWLQYLQEQSHLLWITRELDENGERIPYLW